MSSKSSQKWLERNRPPRVQISYDVEIGDAVEKKELPLVVGILSDLSGMTTTAGAEQRFIEIDRDNFNTVLGKIAPTIDVAALGLRVEGLPSLSGTLTFNTMDDFSPDAIVQKVTGLKELHETRKHLRDLMAKLDGNAALEAELTKFFFQGGQAVPDADRKRALDALLASSSGEAATPATPATPDGQPNATPEGGTPDNGASNP